MSKTVNTGLKIALGIAIALFLALGIYSLSLYNAKQENEKVLLQEKAKVLSDLNQIQQQYEVALEENTIVNQNLIDAKDRIKGLIDSLKTSDASVKSLWKYKKKYIALQEEMTNLLKENDKLRYENQLLATTLDSTTVALDNTTIRLEERRQLADSLIAENTALIDVVETAAVLNANSMKAFGVIERSSGKQIPTERARRSDKIKVCFTVAKNTLVTAGNKKFYVQVIDPKNNVLGLNETVNFGDKTLNYSLISEFNYQNKNFDICEYISKKNKKDDFEKGLYNVTVFNGNTLVTKTQFELR